jgi:hypothetical protein
VARQANDASTVDWQAWHSGYEDAGSALRRRLTLVQAQLRGALDRAPAGPIRLISICAGQGHDVIGVLAEHPRATDVQARLVELDADNVAIARAAADAAGLSGVEAIAADASLSDSYAGATPADVILICGVFGNIAAEDATNTIEQLAQLCAAQATVIWTRHRHAPDLVPHIRSTFAEAGFGELAFADTPPFGVGANRLQREPRAFRPGVRLFEFIGHRALWPHLRDDQRAALNALFAPDCSLVELVEAMRALPHGLPGERTPECMLSEARGTSVTKHLFLAQVMAQRFAQTEPQLVHRVYGLDRDKARELFGAEVAAAVPSDGLVDVHRYLKATIDGRRVALDVTLAGPAWDERSSLAPTCGPGVDFAAGADPEADLRALEREHCDADAREPFIAALAAAATPPR